MLLDVLRAKWVFAKPKNRRILIYDRYSEDYSRYLFRKKDCEILVARRESLNLYVFFLTLKSLKFKNILDNYKKIYIELVSPKIVYTAIDNNPGFFKLKAVSNKPIYISDQNGMSKVNDSYKQESFYGDLKKYTNKIKQI